MRQFRAVSTKQVSISRMVAVSVGNAEDRGNKCEKCFEWEEGMVEILWMGIHGCLEFEPLYEISTYACNILDKKKLFLGLHTLFPQ